VVDSGVQADLIHHRDAGTLNLGRQLADRVRDVRRRDDVGLVLAGGADDGGVVGVGDKRDDDVVRADGGAERGVVVDVERDSGRARERDRQALRVLEVGRRCRTASAQISA
jgi:hypothetical protein